MADTTIQKFTIVQLTGASAYAAMLASQAAAAASATAAAASAASAASAVNTAVSGTINTIAKFSGTNAVRSSTITDDGTTVSVSAPYLQISNVSPSLVFHESDGATDAKRWAMQTNGGVLSIYTTNDTASTAALIWQVVRGANSITAQQWFTNSLERMRIYADGGVQIGGAFGTSPGAGVTRIGNNTIQQGSIEVNENGIGNRYAYIDLVGDDTYVDYGMRIVRGNTGPNATSTMLHRGTGIFELTTQDSAPVSISTNSLERMRIYADGGVQIGGTFGTSPGAGALHLNGNGSLQTLRVTDSNTGTGANIRLDGDGATTPSKYIRVKSGNLEFVNSAYNAVIASLTDAGVFTASSFKAGANQVVGARDTGWGAMTGTANKNTAYDTASVTLAQLAGRVMALQAALTTHGLIGA